MTARTMWKAEVCLGSERVPVKLYAGVQDQGVHFRLLHAEDLAPVQQQMVDPDAGEPVDKTDIQRGVQVERGVFVVITPEERQALEPAPSRDIQIEQVLDRSGLDLRWFDRPYYLGPDGDDEGYFALARALAARGQVAIARWTMRKKRYRGALYARDGYLVLETLRAAQDMVPIEGLRTDPKRRPDERERKLAEQLIATLEGPFDPTEFRNEYRERVMALIEQKAKGHEPKFPAAQAKQRPGELIDALKASLAQSREAVSA